MPPSPTKAENGSVSISPEHQARPLSFPLHTIAHQPTNPSPLKRHRHNPPPQPPRAWNSPLNTNPPTKTGYPQKSPPPERPTNTHTHRDQTKRNRAKKEVRGSGRLSVALWLRWWTTPSARSSSSCCSRAWCGAPPRRTSRSERGEWVEASAWCRMVTVGSEGYYGHEF